MELASATISSAAQPQANSRPTPRRLRHRRRPAASFLIGQCPDARRRSAHDCAGEPPGELITRATAEMPLVIETGALERKPARRSIDRPRLPPVPMGPLQGAGRPRSACGVRGRPALSRDARKIHRASDFYTKCVIRPAVAQNRVRARLRITTLAFVQHEAGGENVNGVRTPLRERARSRAWRQRLLRGHSGKITMSPKPRCRTPRAGRPSRSARWMNTQVPRGLGDAPSVPLPRPSPPAGRSFFDVGGGVWPHRARDRRARLPDRAGWRGRDRSRISPEIAVTSPVSAVTRAPVLEAVGGGVGATRVPASPYRARRSMPDHVHGRNTRAINAEASRHRHRSRGRVRACAHRRLHAAASSTGSIAAR